MPEGLWRPIEEGDLDEVIRLVDRLCTTRDWDLLVELRDRCRRAVERGRQLWPAAAHAEYRLALEAPGPWAGRVLVEGAGRFAPGPLPEVAASTHEWHELAPHVPDGPGGALAAHERVVRGEDLTGCRVPGPTVLDLPLRLSGWEPAYSLAHYRPDGADFPAPSLPDLTRVHLPTPVGAGHDEATHALADSVRVWTDGSEGRVDAVAVIGDALAAVATLGRERARVAELEPAAALALLAWAGASGGAHGRRPGAAAGRFAAWWAAAALTGLLDRWPLDPDELGHAIANLAWFAWDAGGPVTGWALHLAIEDRRAGRSWAVAAIDPT